MDNYLKEFVVDKTGKLRLREIVGLLQCPQLGAHVYDLPYQMDDPKILDGCREYTTKRQRIAVYAGLDTRRRDEFTRK